MRIHTDFAGGNIVFDRIEGNTVYVERDVRDTEGDWFYWAFCVEDAAGQTLAFRFPSLARVGRFGPAISHDLESWHWLDVSCQGDSFTYTFGEDENKVYFAHNMLYQPPRFLRFCEEKGLAVESFSVSESGKDLPGVRFGKGDKWILLTSRHHACEATGTYVLEGVVDTLLSGLPEDYSVLVVPFVDYNGVVNGDQGKNRKPYDHNRDYKEESIYAVIRDIKAFAAEHNVVCSFDFHSPWHQGEQNDYVFLSRSTEAMEPVTNRFGELFKEESAALPLRYEMIHDVGPNEQWNDETSPNSKNYFAKQTSVQLTATLETPYFGLADSQISQERMLSLGHAFARAVLRYLPEMETAE